ncbi:TIGR03546 family protein [Paraglaciecola sp. 2405UD69-4]|uniref:TIGR03546 family protein n=1 Tax=Paraglaciecola sp. 2405UD69-4 TaxID=3391836 RepID=UPI0039C9D7ED
MGLLAKLFKALNSDDSPWQLAYGFALGMIMGLTPFLGIHSLILLFLVLFLRVNISSFLVAWAVFSVIAIPASYGFSSLGETILLSPSLETLWTSFYGTTIGQLTQIYHTTTLGSLCISILFFPAILLISKKLVEEYRERFMKWVNQWRIVQLIKGSRFFQLYQAIQE